MKRWWEIQAARIDALSLRERVFLFVAVLACCMALADVFWLSPAQTGHRLITQRFAAQDAELQALREELRKSEGETGPGKLMREELAQVKARLETVNSDIRAVPSSVLGATSLPQVLAHFLRRHEGLTLVRTTTLDTHPAMAKGVQGGYPAALTRQGIELTVSGPYPDLIRYVQTLEKSLPALRWGAMRLGSDKQPPQLTLQVSLVGVPQ